MKIDRLIGLRDKVDAALKSKVIDERRKLEAELSKLSRFNGGAAGIKLGNRRGTVAPKYRNPENPRETWADRGLRPRCLTAAIKGGKKPEDFLVASANSVALSREKRLAKRARNSISLDTPLTSRHPAPRFAPASRSSAAAFGRGRTLAWRIAMRNPLRERGTSPRFSDLMHVLLNPGGSQYYSSSNRKLSRLAHVDGVGLAQ
jgi:DNA-binding protein H-NS